MKASKLLHEKLSAACPDMRLKALISGGDLRVNRASAHRNGVRGEFKIILKDPEQARYKRRDRLMGNSHLHAERKEIYQYLSTQLIGTQQHPVLIADWSPMPGNET